MSFLSNARRTLWATICLGTMRHFRAGFAGLSVVGLLAGCRDPQVYADGELSNHLDPPQ